jgi:hypothetical protein
MGKFNKRVQLTKDDIPQPDKVTMSDLLESIKTTKKSPGLSTERYKKWVEEFGSL